MTLAVIDIAILPDASGLYRAQRINFSEKWSEQSVRDYQAKHAKQGPRQYHLVEVTEARMAEIREFKNLGYATDPKDPTTAQPVETWKDYR